MRRWVDSPSIVAITLRCARSSSTLLPPIVAIPPRTNGGVACRGARHVCRGIVHVDGYGAARDVALRLRVGTAPVGANLMLVVATLLALIAGMHPAADFRQVDSTPPTTTLLTSSIVEGVRVSSVTFAFRGKPVRALLVVDQVNALFAPPDLRG